MLLIPGSPGRVGQHSSWGPFESWFQDICNLWQSVNSAVQCVTCVVLGGQLWTWGKKQQWASQRCPGTVWITVRLGWGQWCCSSWHAAALRVRCALGTVMNKPTRPLLWPSAVPLSQCCLCCFCDQSCTRLHFQLVLQGKGWEAMEWVWLKSAFALSQEGYLQWKLYVKFIPLSYDFDWF